MLFEAGGFGWSSDWSPVLDALPVDFTALAYDRAGFGWSDPAQAPRDLEHQLSDLEALLDASRFPAPFIVVGASYGGMIARALAARRRADVAGLVLVDARHPDTGRRLPPAWRRAERQAIGVAQVMELLARVGLLPIVGRLLGDSGMPPTAAVLDPETRATYLAECFGAQAWRSSRLEAQAIEVSDRQAAKIGRPNDIPTIVLRHGVPDLFSGLGDAAADAEQHWVAMQEALTAEASAGVLQTVQGAGHAIHLQRPDVVVAAISDIAAQMPA